MRLLSRIKSFLDFVYPPLCLHCEELMEKGGSPLCPVCFDLLEKIDPSMRCPACFGALEGVCQRCHGRGLGPVRVGAVFDAFGPVRSLLTAFKKREMHGLAPSLASFITLQFLALNFPQPDLIVPIPDNFIKRMTRTFSPVEELAKVVGALLGCPVRHLLKASLGYPSQSFLSREKRGELPLSAMEWKRREAISGKTVLIIDDAIVSGATMRSAASRLREGCPKRILGFALISY